MNRKIIHIDMDAFFASVEQRNNPELKGKPVAVGGSGERSVVAAASYEARKFGVRSALPGVTAKRLCPELIFVKPNFPEYGRISHQIREIFYSYTDLVEPLSFDEAYLDVSSHEKYAVKIAKEIKEKIFKETELTASAGVSYNKFLAKMASDVKKPNGLFVILPEHASEFIGQLKIEKFHGIGEKTAQRLKELGVFNGTDLLNFEEKFLIQHFGKAGKHFYHIARGIDEREVKPNQELKSIGAENTFSVDLSTEDEMLNELLDMAEKVMERSNKKGKKGKTLTLKIKYHDFEVLTRSLTMKEDIDNVDMIVKLTKQLLMNPELPYKPVRLLGITISNFNFSERPERYSSQMKLF